MGQKLQGWIRHRLCLFLYQVPMQDKNNLLVEQQVLSWDMLRQQRNRIKNGTRGDGEKKQMAPWPTAMWWPAERETASNQCLQGRLPLITSRPRETQQRPAQEEFVIGDFSRESQDGLGDCGCSKLDIEKAGEKPHEMKLHVLGIQVLLRLSLLYENLILLIFYFYVTFWIYPSLFSYSLSYLFFLTVFLKRKKFRKNNQYNSLVRWDM